VKFLGDRGHRVVGLELSKETIETVVSTWPGVRIVRGDCGSSPFSTNSMDLVLSFGVVEHWVEGPRKPLAELFRVLKPGGRALITVPCQNAIRSMKRLLWWDELMLAPRAIAGKVLKRKPKPMNRMNRRYQYVVYPAYGDFFEYRMTVSEFRDEVRSVGFNIIQHVPDGNMDGLFHELNPFKLIVKFSEWRFYPTKLAKSLDRLLGRYRFFHSHMQAILASKP
jgi:SAM-dependent methyltransferase